MFTAIARRNLRILLMGWVFLPVAAGQAMADVCLSIDESRDNFSPHDRAAALVLLGQQFELAGERIVAPGCPSAYVVSHVQLGETVTITLAGPRGRRDAIARGLDDVPNVYSQMVRSLMRGQPMTAEGIVDRTNVSSKQSETPNRVYSDSLLYARLGYGAVFGEQTQQGASIGMLGYRRELDKFGIDVSFFNMQYQSTGSANGYGRESGMTGTWLKLEFLHFGHPTSDRSPYVGAGLSWSVANTDTQTRSWSGSGLQGELTAGYEFGRASTIRVFLQGDVGLPFYKLSSGSYVYSGVPPYYSVGPIEYRYAPSVSFSLGLGWQRGGK